MSQLIRILLSVLITIFSFPVFAEKEIKIMPLANTDGGVSTIVNGCVNIITGDYLESSADIVIPGPEPLILERYYASSDYHPSLHAGWSFNHQSYIKLYNSDYEDKKHYAIYVEASGRSAHYNHSKKHQLKLDTSKAKGLTNCGTSYISARTNPKNNQIIYHRDPQHLEVAACSGSFRKFERFSSGYKLISDKKLSRTQTLYDYDPNGNTYKITTTNAAGNNHFAWLKINDYPDISEDETEINVVGSHGRKVVYKLQKFKPTEKEKKLAKGKGRKAKDYFRIVAVESSDKPTVCYKYGIKNGTEADYIVQKSNPGSSYLDIEYYNEKHNDVGGIPVYLSSSSHCLNRVKLLRAPVGQDNSPVITHRFFYDLKSHNLEGTTDVRDAVNHKTLYTYDVNHRLNRVDKFTGDNTHTFYSSENYLWSEDGNLNCKRIFDAQGVHHTAQVFSYDDFGNILHDKFYGNITGTNTGLIIGQGDLPINNGSDCYSTHYEYTKDNWHLLLAKTEDNGKGLLYAYHSGSDLIATELVTDKGQICIRNFYEYDSNSALSKKITDNGTRVEKNDLTDVTERQITYIYNRQTAPVGVPERVDEMYLDITTGNEVLLHRTLSAFSIEGRLLKQDHYDSNGVHRYSLFWEYDLHGNVTKEMNALGEMIVREYDSNDNLIHEKGPNLSYEAYHKYDRSNRLIETTEHHSDGTALTTHYSYDVLNNLKSQKDHFGNETKFIYDEFNRLVQTIYPSIPNVSGHLIQTHTENEYDLLGNVKKFRNQQQEEIHATYNVYGDPLTIQYPDKTLESFTYNMDGTLRKAVTKNGSYTLYTHDCFGRLLKEEVYSSKNELLSCVSSTYDSFHKTSATDAEGNLTRFGYDGAGRNISIATANSLITIEHDLLGRKYKTMEWCDKNKTECRVTIQSYDLLDRVIEERIEDIKGNILWCEHYAYDVDGNQTHIYSDSQAGESVVHTEYDSHKQPICITDPLGNITQITYDYNYVNSYGQKVLASTLTDSLGNQTITIMNALKEVGSIIRKNSSGNIIAKKELFYDGLGNCETILETVITPNQPNRVIKTLFKYDYEGKLLSLTEAFETSKQRKTSYHYNAFGQKDIMIKPDGTKILYGYDSKGLLSFFRSSDNSFSYAYEYNRNDLPVKIKDLKQQTITSRSYDDSNQLIEETLATGFSFKYGYDWLGRLIQTTLPDGSGVKYTYDPLHLKEVQRTSAFGKVLYVHRYDDYDLANNLKSSTLIGQAGKMNFKRDFCKRLTSIQHSKWSLDVPVNGYDTVGNLLQQTIYDSKGIVDCKYTYDPLYQLASESGVATHNYSCDSINNRVQKNGSKYAVNALNELLQESDINYSYDLSGNLIKEANSKEEKAYMYDALDRLTSIVKGDWKFDYQYDAFNRRLSKVEYAFRNGTWNKIREECYLYQDQNEIGTIDSKGTIKELRVLGEGKGAEIGAAVALEINGKIYAPIHDFRGNITCLIDSTSGECVETYRHSAFGEEQLFDQSGVTLVETNTGNQWRYSSKRVDSESNLVNFGRRYYNPRIGRWTAPDPLGLTEVPNLYAYLSNNPLIKFDLYGLFDEWESDFDSDQPFGIPFGDSLRSTVGGIAHGTLDFGIRNLQWMHWSTSYIGATEVGLDINERSLYMDSLEHLHEDQLKFVGKQVMRLFLVNDSDATYQRCRYGTTLSMELGSLVGGGYGGVKSLLGKLNRLPMQAAKLGIKGISSFENLDNGPACSVVKALRLKNNLTAKEIAGGHAFEKHILLNGEFCGFIRTREQLRKHVEMVLNNPTSSKLLERGRSAYWHNETSTMVIRNPKVKDGGTVFQPTTGFNFYDKGVK